MNMDRRAYTMIRRAIQECPPAPCALLREAHDDVTRRANHIIQFRLSIAHLPYHSAQVVKTIRLNHDIQRTCKHLLARRNVPLDVFSHIDEYLYETVLTHNKLPNRGFTRAVHHLIRLERVALVEQALAVGKYFDGLRIGLPVETREDLLRAFRNDLWPFMRQDWPGLGAARPELWYLLDSFAIGYI